MEVHPAQGNLQIPPIVRQNKVQKQFLQVRQDNVSGLFQGSKRHKNGPTDKSWVSFEKFRKFSI